MSLYIKVAASGSVAVGICDRCKFKFSLNDLNSDPDYPGLRVCEKCADLPDPYRLPSRAPEDITIQYPRPESPLDQ